MNINEKETEQKNNINISEKIRLKRGPKPKKVSEYPKCPKCGYTCRLIANFNKHLNRKTSCNVVKDYDYIMNIHKRNIKNYYSDFEVIPKIRKYKPELSKVLHLLKNELHIMKNFEEKITDEEKNQIDNEILKYQNIIDSL